MKVAKGVTKQALYDEAFKVLKKLNTVLDLIIKEMKEDA